MPQRRLAESLQQLHDELHAAPDLDAETRQLLRAVLDDIAAVLSETPRAPQTNDTLMGRLSEATRDFETSHPRLTLAVGQVADALSSMGI